jgi:hypothetical protein
MKSNKTNKELLFERMQYVNPELKLINEDQNAINYYQKQLNYIDTDGEYPAKFQFHDAKGSKTNFMDLNTESANVLINWLKSKFSNNTENSI